MISHDKLNFLLELAATNDHTDIAKMLVAAGADAFEVLKEATKCIHPFIMLRYTSSLKS